MTEYWNAYLENGQKTEHILERGKAIPQGLYHLVVECILIHTDGSILFMQRDDKKESYPHYYEATAGGSAVLNESPETAILREVAEETGIHLQASQLIHYHHFVAHDDQCIFDLYWAKVDAKKDIITVQNGETSDFVWVAPADLPNFLETQPIIPRQKEYVEQLILEKE
ncbi:NUDIX domain-containing protein [Streptococcus sp. zg-86]|uniref:NUDIX domain-containing protein n=1 Tax=Streptococcus zhangguiae TaxID=2664091 RepID=A0A6I4RG96_9STRE|nr:MULTISPECIES: NUDIX hydrolase [unclassified Streptococcus]MTB63549.1 NUDIX domain-containing protein [Streptococcus sp. zg-86]MTB89802.1 NUDIX domain-containing protein [Streptococcus sp. zg-36]MWV55473.1 NUDIX domain-containing protein [Streptococcus sp. zg-70]QTH47664.1 NUDIX hydrolase [Streptococcus sp. zg-86]